jgi:hypothetical protein
VAVVVEVAAEAAVVEVAVVVEAVAVEAKCYTTLAAKTEWHFPNFPHLAPG